MSVPLPGSIRLYVHAAIVIIYLLPFVLLIDLQYLDMYIVMYAVKESGILGSLLLGCVIAHELGHLFVAKYFGVMGEGVVLAGIVGITLTDETRLTKLSKGKRIILYAAGSTANLVCASLLLCLAWGLHIEESRSLIRVAAYMNLFIGMVNLAPVYPLLDGGKIFADLLRLRSDGETINRNLVKMVSGCAVVGLAGFALATTNWIMLVVVILLGIATPWLIDICEEEVEQEETYSQKFGTEKNVVEVVNE
mgnify:CR=1 FL=1